MISISINQQECQIKSGSTVQQLVLEFGYSETMTAVWINGEQIMQSAASERKLISGDQVSLYPITIGG